MNKNYLAALLLALAACSSETGKESVPPSAADALQLITAERIYEHLEYLASDELEGRAVGEPGYDLAAAYVREQFADIGLEPGGDDGWYQQVELQSYRVEPDSVSMVVHRDGEDREFVYQEEFGASGDKVRPENEVRGEVVYVGYGVHAPAYDYSDLDGVDLDGKIVAYFSGGPSSIPSEELAHFASSRTKQAEWAERGAIGSISLYSRRSEETYPWERARKYIARNKPSMTWVNASGEAESYFPEIRGAAFLSPDAGRDFLAGTPISLEEARDAIEASQVASVPLGFEVTLARKTVHARLTSPNVIGVLPGSDPELADEYVVFTAHLDHVGRGIPVDGDEIYNGMYDNAMGTAIMIENARALAANPPRRSVMFIALAAEEKGLLGSAYFAEYPTVPIDSIVANVNMDMPLFLFQTRQMVGFGAEHSSLGAVTEKAAAEEGLELIPDPMPEEILFSRSDQFSFVRKGVPAIYLDTSNVAVDPDVDGPAIAKKHLLTVYHKPSDDLSQPIDEDTMLRFARTNVRLGWAIGNAAARPTWNDDSFYGKLFGR